MEKTYFRQLLDLYDECCSIDGVAKLLFEDALGRCGDWLLSHDESDVCCENDIYIKRNLDFIRSVVENKKK